MFRLSNAIATTALTSIASAVAGGSLTFYTTPMPDSVDEAVGDATTLATFTLPSPAFTVSNHVALGTGVLTTDAVVDGRVAWGRFCSSNGTAVMDVDIDIEDAAIILNNRDLVADTQVRIMSMAITFPLS